MAKRKLNITDKDVMAWREMYEGGMSTLQIARRYGCLGGSVHARLVAAGVKMRPFNWRPPHRRADSRGYVHVNGGKYEHRVVAEKMIGRKLRATEHVHHKNHNKSDNRPENLEVCSSASEHMKKHTERGYWTDEMDNVLRTMRQDGAPTHQIASFLGVSYNAVVNRVVRLKRHGRIKAVKVGRKAKKMCGRGHVYDEVGFWDNKDGHRQCKACRKIWLAMQEGACSG